MQVVTRKMEKEQRIADLQRLAESIGLRWGGVAKGNKVTVYFNDSPHTMRNLLEAETMIFCWHAWHCKGDRKWFTWNEYVFRPTT